MQPAAGRRSPLQSTFERPPDFYTFPALVMLSTFWLLFVVSAPPLLAVDIPESCELITLYREMGCTPIFERDSLCPVEYDCGNFKKSDPNMCYYNGKAYAKGEELKDEDSTDPCQHHCKCLDAFPKTGGAAWRCAAGECFGDKFIPGCVSTYDSLMDCCRLGTYCEKTDPKPELTCSYKGKTYVEGEQFYDDDKCKRCICNANFNDTLEGPSCQYQSCGHLLLSISNLRDGCVPVYYGKSHCSCPIENKCPESTDAIAQSTKDLDHVPESRTGRSCKFGDLTLKVGDKLVKRENELFECSCETPPFLTCVQKPHKEQPMEPLEKAPNNDSRVDSPNTPATDNLAKNWTMLS